jgi:hypothetical protein
MFAFVEAFFGCVATVGVHRTATEAVAVWAARPVAVTEAVFMMMPQVAGVVVEVMTTVRFSPGARSPNEQVSVPLRMEH